MGTAPEGELDTTIKMPKIDEEAIAGYRKKEQRRDAGSNGAKREEYAEYAQEVDRAVEDRKLREINEKRERREQKKKERRITLIAILTAVLVVAAERPLRYPSWWIWIWKRPSTSIRAPSAL